MISYLMRMAFQLVLKMYNKFLKFVKKSLKYVILNYYILLLAFFGANFKHL